MRCVTIDAVGKQYIWSLDLHSFVGYYAEQVIGDRQIKDSLLLQVSIIILLPSFANAIALENADVSFV